MTLPEIVRVSYGTAITLGLLNARQDVPPTTAYLLWDPGCQGSCSFCPRSNGNAATDRLSRISWPEFPWPDVVSRLSRVPEPIRRICLQTGWNHEASNVLPDCIKSLAKTGLPVSTTLHPAQIEMAGSLFPHGLDHVGIGLDAASPDTYLKHKHRSWNEDWPALMHLLEVFGKKIEVHLIFGLGDSEKRFVATIDEIASRKGLVALFALTPRLRTDSRPSLGAWRRIQAFRFLRACGDVSLDNCRFSDNDELIGFGFPVEGLHKLLEDGRAFETCGCSDCNRPFYNERPGGCIYNFPRPMKPDEVSTAIADMALTDNILAGNALTDHVSADSRLPGGVT